VLGRCWQEFGRRTLVLWMCVTLGLTMIGCSQAISSQKVDAPIAIAIDSKSQIEEVSPPEELLQLGLELDQYEPQIKLSGLEPDETVTDTTVNIRLQVKDFPIYKDAKLGLGPHIHVLLDNQPYQTLYNVSDALTFKDLSPGTHTVRAFAVRPWDESFKTVDASAQVTFHVFTPTQSNRPDPTQPLLTYNNPQGEYGAEPIMLDYSVTLPNSKTGRKTSIAPWSVNVSLNGQSFKTSEEGPIYLKGFRPGVNWLKLELLSASGKPVANAFSETVRLITFNPNGKDTLSQLVRGELTAQDAERIVNRRVSKRLAEQEKAAQEDQEALAAEAAKDAAKRESAKTAAPIPEAPIKKTTSAVEPAPILALPRSPSASTNPIKSIAKPAPERSLPSPSKTPMIQPSPSPAPLEKTIEKAEETQVKQDVPLWSKLKSTLFSNKAASEAQPKAARSTPSKTVSSKIDRKIEDSVQPAPQSSPVPLKMTAPPETKLKPVKVAEPISSPNSAAPGSVSPSSSLQDAPSLKVPKVSSDPLEPLQKFLDFQPLDPENLPVIQQKTGLEVPSRYLKQSQPLNQLLEPLPSEMQE
jgi:hypothetical protein